MNNEGNRNLVVCITHGIDHELSSVGWTVACGGLTSGLDVSIFLTSGGVDLVREGASDAVHVEPMDPLKELIEDFIDRGGTVWACTPCVRGRGYEDSDLIDGVTVTGASLMHELIGDGAATLSF
jgi:predicted peroxiredoxin